MTPRSIRRAQERKARKEMERKARKQMERKFTQAALNSGKAAFEETADLEYSEETSISPAQLTANRANAQLSTGPTSPEGKAKASLNAVKSGLTGRTVLLVGDDAAEYDRRLRAFAEEYAPVGQREADLVQSIADSWWRLQRIPNLENALFAQGYVEFADAFEDHDPALRLGLIQAQAFLKYEKQIRNLNLQESRLFRRYEKDRAELRELQQLRRNREMEALETAHLQHHPAATDAAPVEPLSNGFEFSTVESQPDFAPVDIPNLAETGHDSAHPHTNVWSEAA